MKILLKNNNPFKWHIINNIYFKGYFYFEELLYEGEIAIKKIKEKSNDIDDFLNKINGIYTILIEDKKEITIITDILRTMPILYSFEQKIITDDIMMFSKLEIDLKEKELFILSGFVQGNKTIFKGINQTQSGLKVIIKENKIIEKEYFNIKLESEEINKNILEKLDSLHIDVFKRLIISLKNKRAIIPLSGGQDSRLIITMLKRLNYKNVLCFSYGKLENKESLKSKNIAEDLGYEWIFIEYDKNFNQLLETKEYKEYEIFAAQGVGLAHIQDFYAVKLMKKKNILKKDDIFIPGHSYDFLAGSHLKKEIIDKNFDFSKENLKREIIEKHYNLWPNFKWIEILGQKIEDNYLKEKKIKNKYDFVEILDSFNMKERQSKFIVNSIKVYEYFGYQWRIPLWDIKLIEFWEKISLEKKLGRQLYFEYTNFEKTLSYLTKYDAVKIDTRRYRYLKKYPTLIKYLKKILKIFKYNSHELNFNKIQTKTNFIYNTILGQENINSILSKKYIKNIEILIQNNRGKK